MCRSWCRFLYFKKLFKLVNTQRQTTDRSHNTASYLNRFFSPIPKKNQMYWSEIIDSCAIIYVYIDIMYSGLQSNQWLKLKFQTFCRWGTEVWDTSEFHCMTENMFLIVHNDNKTLWIWKDKNRLFVFFSKCPSRSPSMLRQGFKRVGWAHLGMICRWGCGRCKL